MVTLAAMAVVGYGQAEPIQTADKPALEVHLTNGSGGGQIAEGTEVMVHFYQGENLIEKRSSAADPNGKCTFSDIPAGENIVAVAQAKHSDMAFSSAPLQLRPDQKQYELTVQVFDITYDNSLIQVGTHHLFLQKSGSNVHIKEYIQLINNTDKAILSETKDAAGRPEVVQIRLPENAKDLSFTSYFHPDAVIQTDSGFYDTMAIPPGTYHAAFAYNVPLQPQASELSKAITLPTESLMVFIQVDSGIRSELGEPAGRMALKDGVETDYYSVDVKPGSVLKFHVEAIAVPKSQKDVWIILGIVFGFVVLVALFRVVNLQPKK